MRVVLATQALSEAVRPVLDGLVPPFDMHSLSPAARRLSLCSDAMKVAIEDSDTPTACRIGRLLFRKKSFITQLLNEGSEEELAQLKTCACHYDLALGLASSLEKYLDDGQSAFRILRDLSQEAPPKRKLEIETSALNFYERIDAHSDATMYSLMQQQALKTLKQAKDRGIANVSIEMHQTVYEAMRYRVSHVASSSPELEPEARQDRYLKVIEKTFKDHPAFADISIYAGCLLTKFASDREFRNIDVTESIPEEEVNPSTQKATQSQIEAQQRIEQLQASFERIPEPLIAIKSCLFNVKGILYYRRTEIEDSEYNLNAAWITALGEAPGEIDLLVNMGSTYCGFLQSKKRLAESLSVAQILVHKTYEERLGEHRQAYFESLCLLRDSMALSGHASYESTQLQLLAHLRETGMEDSSPSIKEELSYFSMFDTNDHPTLVLQHFYPRLNNLCRMASEGDSWALRSLKDLGDRLLQNSRFIEAESVINQRIRIAYLLKSGKMFAEATVDLFEASWFTSNKARIQNTIDQMELFPEQTCGKNEESVLSFLSPVYNILYLYCQVRRVQAKSKLASRNVSAFNKIGDAMVQLRVVDKDEMSTLDRAAYRTIVAARTFALRFADQENEIFGVIKKCFETLERFKHLYPDKTLSDVLVDLYIVTLRELGFNDEAKKISVKYEVIEGVRNDGTSGMGGAAV